MSVTTPQDEPGARAAPQHRRPAEAAPRNGAPSTPPPCSCGGAPSTGHALANAPGETRVGGSVGGSVDGSVGAFAGASAGASAGVPVEASGRAGSRTGFAPDDGPWFDGAAGRLVRPYTVSNGRTRPVMALDLLARLHATGTAPLGYLTPEHRQALALCRTPVSVAEVAGRLRLPLAVTKVLLGDLLDAGSLTVQAPAYYDDPVDRSLLEAVLDGLRRRL